jgi:serine protease Do
MYKYASIILAACLVGIVLGGYLNGRYSGDGSGSIEAPPADHRPVLTFADYDNAIAISRRNAIVTAAEEVGPSVVSISTTQTQYVYANPFGMSPFGDEMFRQFFGRYFVQRGYERTLQGLGSGVIIDEEGYVLTNDHVVSGAEAITVTLTDGRQFAGTILGEDPTYDLAVIKIDAEDLPVAELGDSDDLMIGEWAIAIGNPFAHFLKDTTPSVTVGVVSALGRDIVPEHGNAAIYKGMIQTDAAINPGNSGGPLVSGEGKVIGINTFIFTKSGGSLGIGFAIPIAVAERVIDELVRYGEVRDVWVGVRVTTLTPETARSLGIAQHDGLSVAYVDPGSPADKAGIEPDDVIIEIEGQPIHDADDAEMAIFGAQVGETVQMTLLRGEDRIPVTLMLQERPQFR